MKKNKIKKYYSLEVCIPGTYINDYIKWSQSKFKCIILFKKYIYAKALKVSGLQKQGAYLTVIKVTEEYCQSYERGANDV